MRINKMPFDIITARQWEILVLMSEGHSTKEIAKKLGIARTTVRNHKSIMYRRMKVNGGEHAIAMAFDREWMKHGT